MSLLSLRVSARAALVALAIASASTSAAASTSVSESDLAGMAALGRPTSECPECEAKCGKLITSEFMKACEPDHVECAQRLMWKNVEIWKCWTQVLRPQML